MSDKNFERLVIISCCILLAAVVLSIVHNYHYG